MATFEVRGGPRGASLVDDRYRARSTRMAQRSWLPVESNPDVFNPYASRLGWPTSELAFADLLSLDDWAVDMLPKPVHAVAMLYLIKPVHEAHREAEEAARLAAPSLPPASLPYFMRQEIPNACGTVALIHSVAAASTAGGGPVAIPADSWLAKFIGGSADATPDERAAQLGADDAIDAEQAVAVAEGQSDAVDNTWQHFICFVEKAGRLWELDGRKAAPIDHGPCARADLLAGAIRVMRAFMARDPEEVRFTMLALCPPVPADE